MGTARFSISAGGSRERNSGARHSARGCEIPQPRLCRNGRDQGAACLRHTVPFDHWILLSGSITPSMFHGAPTLSVTLLDSRPCATSPLSLFMSSLDPVCPTLKVCPDHWHEVGSGCNDRCRSIWGGGLGRCPIRRHDAQQRHGHECGGAQRGHLHRFLSLDLAVLLLDRLRLGSECVIRRPSRQRDLWTRRASSSIPIHRSLMTSFASVCEASAPAGSSTMCPGV